MKRILLGAMTLMLVGCADLSAFNGDKGTLDQTGNAILEVVSEFRDGGYKTQAEIKNYTRTDIKQLALELIRLEKNGETWQVPAELTADNRKVNSIQLSETNPKVRFTSLRPKTSYRIRWYAYNATG